MVGLPSRNIAFTCSGERMSRAGRDRDDRVARLAKVPLVTPLVRSGRQSRVGIIVENCLRSNDMHPTCRSLSIEGVPPVMLLR
jgi:hypothetical protein